jgi:hypothetical protein
MASLNAPAGLGFDASGNLFVSEFNGNRIRKIDAETGIITTVAGNGVAGFSGDGGPAVNASLAGPIGLAIDSGGNLFIADSNNGRVRRVDGQNGTIATVAGNGANNGYVNAVPDGTPALYGWLSYPRWVSFDGSGNLLISEAGSATIQRLDSAGLLRNVAGNSTQTFTGDGIAATNAGIGPPSNVAVDPAGNLFFGDGARVRRVDATTGVISTVAGNGTGTGGAQACISASNGENGPATDATIDGTMGIALMPNGNLLLSAYADCRVRRIALPSPLAYTATGLSADGSSLGVGQNVTFTAHVSPIGTGGAPGGVIRFVDGYPNFTTLATVPLSSGNASFTTSFPATGYHNVVAYYSGDSLFNSSASPMASVRVQSPTTVNLTSSQNPSTVNQSVTFTVTIPQLPSPSYQSWGNVTLMDGATQVGSAMVFNGGAQFNFTFAATGTHPMTAVFSGSGDFAGSTSDVLNQVVSAKAPSSVALTSSVNPSTAGSPINLTATVSPSTATGNVQFLDGGATLGYANLANGAATLTIASLTAGNHSLTAVYAGDSALTGSASSALSQTVKAATATTLSSSTQPSTYGQPLTLTATVTPSAATGSVQFLDGATVLGTAVLGSGSASITVPVMSGGNHSLTAIYSGDGGNGGSTSAVYTQTVQKAAVTAALASSPNPSLPGQAISLSATISDSSATGSVQFLDGSTAIGSAQVANGNAAITTGTLAAGSHSLTAVYSGDGNFSSATSGAVNQVVKANSATTLSADNTSVTFGQTTQLTASVSPSSAAGTIQFLDGATVLGTSAVNGGTATLAGLTLAAGTHSLTAVYSGDANDTGSTSGAVAVIVSKANSSAAMVSSLNPSVAGQAITFTVTITPAGATGSVQFLDGATAIGTATVAGGSAALTTSVLGAGSHSITAAYSGDGSYNGASAGVAQTVKANSATTLSANNTSVTVGQAVVLTAAISPGSATGTVQFLDGVTVLGTQAVTGGSASLSISTLVAGTHSITASYGGDGNNTASTSAAVTVTVTKIAAGVAVISSLNPSVAGQSVTFTATISPAAATGSVQFLDGATVIGTAAVAGGSASLTTSALSPGIRTITAAYSGDATYNSSSASLTQTVKATSTTTLSASNGTPAIGQTVVLTAAISPGSAMGTVQFLDGGTLIGTSAVSGGVASLPVSTLALGTHNLTASYGGDATDTASASNAIVVTVSKISTSVALISSLNPSVTGQSVTFTATVSPASATGSIQFKDGATVLGTVAVSGGSAYLSLSNLAIGSHSITAAYGGDANDLASASSALSQMVNPPPPGAPSNLRSTATSSSQINLNWNASPTSGVTYNVYASATANFTPSASNRIASGITTSAYSNTGLTPSTMVYYRVTAQNAGGESTPSNQDNATTKSH